MKKKMQRFLVFFFAVIMAVAVIPFAVPSTVVEASASSATYSKEYYYTNGTSFLSTDMAVSLPNKEWYGTVSGSAEKKLTDNGYNLCDQDLNESAGGKYVYFGWKTTTNPANAIRALGAYNGSNPPASYDANINGGTYTFYPVPGFGENSSSLGSPIDLNTGGGGDYIYLYYCTDPNYGPPLTDFDWERDSSTNDSGNICQTSVNWINTGNGNNAANLNSGISRGKDTHFFVHSRVDTQVNTSSLHSAITTADNLLANSSNYTSASVTTLQNAVNSGKTIVNDYNADGLSSSYDQTAINNATTAINNAINALNTMIYFDGNGGSVSVASTEITIGGNTTWTFDGDYSGFYATRDNHQFMGWSTSKDTSHTDTANYFTYGRTSISGGFNTTFYAVWKPLTAVATFKNYDGTVLYTTTVNIGETPTYGGATPTKPADERYTYAFSGWSPTVSALTGDIEYVAQFTSTAIQYTITYNYYSGGSTTQKYTYGATITLPNNTAVTSDATGHYTYSWSGVPATVTGTATITEVRTAESHDAYWGDWVVDKAADCTNDGSKHRNCSYCGYTAAEVITANGHTPGVPQKIDIIQGSCTVDASYTEVIKCSVCGTEISRREVVTPAPGHTWGDYTVTTNPTCTDEGVKTRECSVCQTKETAPVDPLGHNFSTEWTVDVDPTCTSLGSKSHHCSRCSEKSDVTPIEKLPHTDGTPVTENNVDPDCENTGKYDTVTYCTVCNNETSRVETIVDALGHTDGEAVIENNVDPDCDTDGKYDTVTYCTVCGDETSRETTTVNALGHKDGEVKTENVVLPDCTTDGSHDEVTYCTVCGVETSRETKTDTALGHTDGAEVKENTVPATCTTDGSYDAVTYCTVCGVKTSSTKKTIPATGHTSGEAVKENEKDPTCTADGSYDAVTYCTVCNAETSRTPVTVDATGHTNAEAVVENLKDSTCKVEGSYDEVVYCSVCNTELSRTKKTIALKEHTPAEAVTENLVDSTCAAEGSYDEVVYCSVCNTELSRVNKTIALKAHTPADAVVENNVDPDCVNTGSYDSVVYCSKCSAELSRTKITVDALGHNFSTEWTVDVEPTCTLPGSKSHHCSRCDAKSDVTVIPETGHSPAAAVKENVTNATCGADGYYEDVVYCSVCNEEISRTPVTVPSTGAHVYAKELERVDPTCTNDGYVVLACGCSDDEKITETLEATGHDYKSAVTEPTCTDKGYTTYTCANGCGSTYVDNYVDANGHSYDKDVTNPDCVNGGYTTYTCSVCGDAYVDDYTDALGHTDGEAVKENETKPTCTAEGKYDSVVYCTVCGEELSRTTVPVDKVAHKPGAEFEENRNNATCTADGSYDIVTECTVCGTETSRETKVINKLGHNPGAPKTENNTPATCTSDGYYDTVVYCTRCQAEISRDRTTVPALGHTDGTPVTENNVAPDCDDDGSYDTVTYCTVCGAETSRETTTVPALGHTDGTPVTENNVAPDCDDKGSYDTVTYCTVCGEETSRETTTVDALGHTAGAEVIENNVDPDCDTDGKYDTVVYCTVCDKELSRETTIVTMLGHTAKDAVKENVVAPKCDEDGSYDEVVYCSVCNDVISRITHTDPATGHAEAEAVVENNVAPDCDDAGSYDKVVYCSKCGEELSRETITVDALGHTPAAAVRENENFGSCLEGGEYDSVIYCSVCGHEISRTHIEVETGTHTPSKAVIENKVNATCTTPSSYDLVVYCKVCGDEISREKIIGSTIAHKSGKAVKENYISATCTTPGSYDQVSYCTVCGLEIARVTVDVGAKGHSIVADPAVNPTCTKDGKTLGSHCSVCNIVIVMQETVPAPGHTEVDDFGYEPTCTKEGLSYGCHCRKCGTVIIAQEVLPPLGHTDLDGDGICDLDGRDVEDMDPNYGVVVNPDADGDGYIDANECEDCGREHTNFFSSIICFFIRIMRLFGYKIT